MRDFLEWLGSFFLIIVPALVLAAAVIEITGRYQCGNYQEVTGRKTKWVVLDSCYVETDRGWQHWGEYMQRAAASEGLSSLAAQQEPPK